MRLSEIELKVLCATEMDASLSIEQIAKNAKVKYHIAHRLLTKLYAAGIVRRRVYIDSYLLGTRPFLVLATI